MKKLIFFYMALPMQAMAGVSPSFQNPVLGLSEPTEAVVVVPREGKRLLSEDNEGAYCYYDGKRFSIGSILKGKICKLVGVKTDDPFLKLSIPQWGSDGDSNGGTGSKH
ncbi:hypothetical protein QK324_07260 [Serratia ureilytica]|uniref:hypothetical protein n=1 Tax=Serratia ureilytica TaxID=300181 RepID=UPI00249C6ADF|nr:hypothetical protein [Serratia ureilytica]MDI3197813.1 hypothetical protein [Serratia ureilytica]